LTAYSDIEWWKKELKGILKISGRNLRLGLFQGTLYDNDSAVRADVVYPDSSTYAKYQSEIDQKTRNDKRDFQPRSGNTYEIDSNWQTREIPDSYDSKVFSDEQSRIVLESELLKVGFKLITYTDYDAGGEIHSKLRYPLGFASGGFGLGFGAMTITFRNCPNTVPLALWMEAGGWTPLFRRKLNAADYGPRSYRPSYDASLPLVRGSEDLELPF